MIPWRYILVTMLGILLAYAVPTLLGIGALAALLGGLLLILQGR